MPKVFKLSISKYQHYLCAPRTNNKILSIYGNKSLLGFRTVKINRTFIENKVKIPLFSVFQSVSQYNFLEIT